MDLERDHAIVLKEAIVESEIDVKMNDPEFLKLLLQNDDEFFKHLNFSTESHLLERQDLAAKMRGNAGMELFMANKELFIIANKLWAITSTLNVEHLEK